ncbi:MAG: hypothetical protein EZS28_036036 [Streblomastix strix]|uniref:Uncharacterized protein n=1 Tax=Streblomastix strix TaxID=222440 RepID=A0A5J4UD27_9EUKA|nr:MAG: hypothetical protein EZS28_036036 [Streblomastix strix]
MEQDKQQQQIDLSAPFQGQLLWADPSLEDMRKRVEDIMTAKITFPPPDQFEFINIYGTGIATPWNLIISDECSDIEQKNEAMHIQNPWEATSDNCKQPLYDTIDGDGTVPAISAANDMMDAAARFEIRNVEHTEMLYSPRVLLLISCIMGLKVLPKVQNNK